LFVCRATADPVLGVVSTTVIVGVGDADFKDMDNLDSDDRLLRTRTGKTATRDIVQFVPFRNFKQRHYSELAQATLAGNTSPHALSTLCSS
jgi:hypothetical protein